LQLYAEKDRNGVPVIKKRTGTAFRCVPARNEPCQKGKTNLDFAEARDSEWQWHQLGHMQVCILIQTDNHASTPTTLFFCRPDALPAAQPAASKH